MPTQVRPRSRKWIGAAMQIAVSTAFMLAFRFPKVMIVVFAALIVIATALSKSNQASACGRSCCSADTGFQSPAL